ncbi:putative peptidylprolyl isomerase [Paratrimastix pyriformis]|uniref:Peptidyl-prolyl cis-trans isomerase n=1 Tax=Paratrimastix pyriformis TaxID=342808 RepID=A0ABQ8UTS2_9EUKA|nr:putative peptidylprolyl isomerase [Paratrimastix pyriformis]
MSRPAILFSTTQGNIKVLLREDAAPNHCRVMKALVQSGAYNGCCFYRAEPGFVVQGGLRAASGETKQSPHGGIPLEYRLPNRRGTVTMARWEDPTSATSEFFINLGENTHLDRTSNSGWGLGFTVWGEVIEGMDVAERIAQLPTQIQGGLKMLRAPVTINSAQLCTV